MHAARAAHANTRMMLDVSEMSMERDAELALARAEVESRAAAQVDAVVEDVVVDTVVETWVDTCMDT